MTIADSVLQILQFLETYIHPIIITAIFSITAILGALELKEHLFSEKE